jgi:hypothetical protein
MVRDLLYRLRALFWRNSVETELDQELRAHLEHQVEKWVQSGLSLEEAERRAKIGLGGLDQVIESRLVKSFLFDTQPNDPGTLALAGVVLLSTAILAGYAPAWRASRIDPLAALRHE